MYPPAQYLVADRETLLRFIEAFPLATLVTVPDDEALVSHVPLVHVARGGEDLLVGHLDVCNPQGASLDGARAVAVFHGPDCYVSPTVHVTPQLPTWSSLNVHARGVVALLRSADAVRSSLVRMTERLERGADRFVLEEDDRRLTTLLPGVVGFEMSVERMEGLFRLSQEKSPGDRARANRRLLDSTAPAARAFLERVLGAT